MATLNLNASGYTGLTGMSISGSYPATNAYDASTDTSNYARFSISTNTTGYVYFIFDCSDIPAGATITSITGTARLRISSASRVTNRVCQLCTGTTTKGSNVNFSSTTSGGTSVTLSPGSSWTRSELNNLRLKIGGTGSSSTSSKYIYVYGISLTINYTIETIHPTGVSINPANTSVEMGNTVQLVETIIPSNATETDVTWSSSNTSIATVDSSGLVTGVSPGSATITVTTVDGGYTATCAVTVTQAVLYTYKLVTSMEVGKKYLIANGNTGSIYLLSNESGGSRQLVGVTATVSNNKITINGATKSRVEYECVRYTSGNDVTITVQSDNKYLYCDNASGLRLEASSSLNRFWHYRDNKFWQFKSTSDDGYSDTSSEYKYYLELTGNNFTDNHVTSPSIEDSMDLPAIYIFTEDDGSGDESTLYAKINNTWTPFTKAYKKINGSWVLQSDLTTIFNTSNNYRKGN